MSKQIDSRSLPKIPITFEYSSKLKSIALSWLDAIDPSAYYVNCTEDKRGYSFRFDSEVDAADALALCPSDEVTGELTTNSSGGRGIIVRAKLSLTEYPATVVLLESKNTTVQEYGLVTECFFPAEFQHFTYVKPARDSKTPMVVLSPLDDEHERALPWIHTKSSAAPITKEVVKTINMSSTHTQINTQTKSELVDALHSISYSYDEMIDLYHDCKNTIDFAANIGASYTEMVDTLLLHPGVTRLQASVLATHYLKGETYI